jgi:hypothetical protein
MGPQAQTKAEIGYSKKVRQTNSGLRLSGLRRSPRRLCAKQRLTLPIEATLAGNKAGIVDAGIVKRTVPAASLAPFAPGDVVAIPAVGISCIPRCAKEALTLTGGARGELPRHRWRRQQDGDSAEKPKSCHATLPGFRPIENHEVPAEFPLPTLKEI